MILIETFSKKGFKLGFDIEGNLCARECSLCRSYEAIINFNKNKTHPFGYTPHCKLCCASFKKSHYKANKEKILANCKVYRETNNEIIKKKKSQYGKKVRKEAWWKEKNKSWKLRNKDRLRALSAKDRACRRKASIPLSDALLEKIVRFYKKAVILEQSFNIRYEVDHIIPIKHEKVCGLHVPWNLVVIPKDMNGFKRNSFDGTYENLSWRERFLKSKAPA